VIAKPVNRRTRQARPVQVEVAALSVRMLSVINPVVPAGFEFAVVGDDGTVLFHSDSARNLSEDFFEETDQDQRFKSIVLARHDEGLDIRYWGESYRAFAVPVKGLPWTIVAMRNEQVLERVNLDWLVTALIFVLFYTSAITVASGVTILARPGYRLDWVWPDPHRRHDYARLIVIFAVLCLAFLIALFGLRGTGFLFGVAGLLPGVSFAAAYLRLNQGADRSGKRSLVEACGVLSFALLAWALYAAPPEDGAGSRIKWMVFALVVLACVLAVDGPRRWRGWKTRTPISRSYPLLGLLLALLVAVLPTAGFFKIAHRLQVDSFVRNGQLKMAKALYERGLRSSQDRGHDSRRSLAVTRLIDSRRGAPFPEPLKSASLDFYGWAFFKTEVISGKDCKAEEKEEQVEPLAALLPPYSDYTAESRELLHAETSDDDWRWCEEGARTIFDGKGYLGVSLASEVDPVWRGNGPLLAMAGLIPLPQAKDLLDETERDPVMPSFDTVGLTVGQGLRFLVSFISLCIFLFLLYSLVLFVARRVFLLDVDEPLWAGRTVDLPSMVGANVLLISRTRSWRIHDRDSFFPLSFRDLGELEEGENGWPACRSKLVLSPPSNVLVEGFEHRAFDPVWNARKLEILEELIFVHQRAVVMLSEVSPTILSTPKGAPSDRTEERWRTLLDSFAQINYDVWPPSERPENVNESLLHAIRKAFQPRRARAGTAGTGDGFSSRLLNQECGQDPFLIRIGQELKALTSKGDREKVLEELGERAQGYFGAIWASCSHDERVVLGHLAEEGLVNSKNRRIVRRLMARGLLQRAPNLRLMNETFRRFVTSPVCKDEVLRLEQAAGLSAWDHFHWPFSTILAACAALILITQQELLDSTLATVTGVTAGLPNLIKLFDLLGWKRGAKSAASLQS
jgi:hypothetical protein